LTFTCGVFYLLFKKLKLEDNFPRHSRGEPELRSYNAGMVVLLQIKMLLFFYKKENTSLAFALFLTKHPRSDSASGGTTSPPFWSRKEFFLLIS
jgi:hypothetical protein